MSGVGRRTMKGNRNLGEQKSQLSPWTVAQVYDYNF